MRQLLYISSSTLPGYQADIDAILEQSRHNNALDGITGLLWSDGQHFLQVLEGPEQSVSETMGRILSDERHSAIVVLKDEPITERQFGTWSMVHRRADDPADDYDAQARRLLAGSSEGVRDKFLSLIATGER